MVSKDSNGLRIVSLLDWQHAVVLPLFLQAGIPEFIQHEDDDDEESGSMVGLKLPSGFDELSEKEKEWEQELLRRRLVHFHYNMSTALYNQPHHQALVEPLNGFRRRTFREAMAPWEGETFKLRYALMDVDVLRIWEDFAKGDDEPFPVDFSEEEVRETEKMYEALKGAEEVQNTLMNLVGCGDSETWVPVDGYEEAKAMGEKVKSMTLESAKERENEEKTEEESYKRIEENWPLDDVDEEEWEEYYQ